MTRSKTQSMKIEQPVVGCWKARARLERVCRDVCGAGAAAGHRRSFTSRSLSLPSP